MTEPGGPAWRQTIYWPFMLASKYGRGTAMHLAVEVPGYASDFAPEVPWLDIAGVRDDDAGTLTFFAINRSSTETMEVDLALDGFAAKTVEHTLIKHADLFARNTKMNPDNVAPQKGSGAKLGGKGLQLTLPPHSYSMIRVGL
jgi:alpha-N-arabinofuranosidase